MVNIVVDASAIVAIIKSEPEAVFLTATLAAAQTRVMTSLNLLEAQIVTSVGNGLPREIARSFADQERIDIVPFDEHLSELAFEVYRTFGKGRHPARLNMGDCAAYALARARGWPLLWKGHDFTLTDIERA